METQLRLSKPVGLVLACTAIFVVFLVVFRTRAPRTDGPWVQVTKVVDGDTIHTGKTKVRLKCVDTPETVDTHKPVQCYGPEASRFATQSLLGRRIRLEFDPKDAKNGHRDFFGRTLAYVYLEDGTLFNLEIVRQGYGRTMPRYPCSRKNEFRRVEAEAREANRGLWGVCPRS
jgi:micrococcal nuclease